MATPQEVPTPKSRKGLSAAVILLILVVVIIVAVAVSLSPSQAPEPVSEEEYISRMSGVFFDYSNSITRFTNTLDLYLSGILSGSTARAQLGDEFLVLAGIGDRVTGLAVPCAAYQSFHVSTQQLFTVSLNAMVLILDGVEEGDLSKINEGAIVGFSLAIDILSDVNQGIDDLQATLPNCP